MKCVLNFYSASYFESFPIRIFPFSFFPLVQFFFWVNLLQTPRGWPYPLYRETLEIHSVKRTSYSSDWYPKVFWECVPSSDKSYTTRSLKSDCGERFDGLPAGRARTHQISAWSPLHGPQMQSRAFASSWGTDSSFWMRLTFQTHSCQFEIRRAEVEAGTKPRAKFSFLRKSWWNQTVLGIQACCNALNHKQFQRSNASQDPTTGNHRCWRIF